MNRLLALIAALLLLSGCSQVLGTSDWTRVEVAYEAGSAKSQKGDYTLVVAPTELSHTVGGKKSSQALPEGVWEALTTGVRALGGRESQACPGGQFITIKARAGDAVKQTYQASSCDAGDALEQAQAVVGKVLDLVK